MICNIEPFLVGQLIIKKSRGITLMYRDKLTLLYTQKICCKKIYLIQVVLLVYMLKQMLHTTTEHSFTFRESSRIFQTCPSLNLTFQQDFPPTLSYLSTVPSPGLTRATSFEQETTSPTSNLFTLKIFQQNSQNYCFYIFIEFHRHLILGMICGICHSKFYLLNSYFLSVQT